MKASEGLRNLILRFQRASMETVRVRLEFKRRGVLAESQLTEGLRRTWLLLKPEIECISDLAAYLLHTFNLQESCPNGLVLSVPLSLSRSSSPSFLIFQFKMKLWKWRKMKSFWVLHFFGAIVVREILIFDTV